MAIHKVPSCTSDHDPEALSADEAMSAILAESKPVTQTDTLPLRDAPGRTLAEAPMSPVNVPGQTNSAMDGYALSGDDLPDKGETTLRVVGKAFAGKPFDGAVGAGECVRIMTGAALPESCDTVIMQEHVEVSDEHITIDDENKRGQNIRLAGEDISKGSQVLEAGRLLTAADIGLLASIGLSEVSVWRKPRVGFFSTGSEIISAGQAAKDYQLYDSNRHTLDAMLARHAVDKIDLGIIPDERAAIRETLEDAMKTCDLLISTGSASVGETDYIADIIQELGTLHFRKVAIKPGRPLTLATIGSATYLALPGNPVSTMVMFYYYVRPALIRISGASDEQPLRLSVTCTSRLKKRPGRLELQRGVLSRCNGAYEVKKTGAQGSGILRSMSEANCLIVLDEDCTGIEPGAAVQVLPFYGLV